MTLFVDKAVDEVKSVPVEMPISFLVIVKKVKDEVNSLRLGIELLFLCKEVKFEENELMSDFESAIVLDGFKVERKVVSLEGGV